MDGMSNLYTKWWKSLELPLFEKQYITSCSQYFCSIPFPFSSWYNSSQYPFHTRLPFVQLQSNFCQSLTGYIAVQTWPELSSHWFNYLEQKAALTFILSSLLPTACICFPAGAVYPLYEETEAFGRLQCTTVIISISEWEQLATA